MAVHGHERETATGRLDRRASSPIVPFIVGGAIVGAVLVMLFGSPFTRTTPNTTPVTTTAPTPPPATR